MEIDRIKLSEEVNVFGRHFWAGFEAKLSETDNPVECMRKLQEKIDEFCNPVIDESQRGTIIREIKTDARNQYGLPQEIQPKELSVVDSINSCAELKVLESYKFIAKTKPEYQEAYDMQRSRILSEEDKKHSNAAEV